MNVAIPIISSKKLMIIATVLLSVLLVAYSPMVAVGHAETAANLQKLKELKQKEIDELTRRITDLEATQKSLADTVQIDKDGQSPASVSATGGITSGYVELPSTLKGQVKDYNQKIIDELKQLLAKAQTTTTLGDAQAIAANVDAQAPLSFISNIQSAITNSIESLTGVLGTVKSSTSDLQGQVTKIKDCTSGSASSTESGCDGLNTSSAGTATAAQSQLDSLAPIISTITSVLMSAIPLLLTLLTTFTSMAGGLGGGGSLGSLSSISSLGSLSSLGDLSSITSLAGSLGSFSSLLGPLTSISSQLDIGSLMSGNALGSLSSLTSLINI